MDIAKQLSLEFSMSEMHINNVINLIDDGNTIPFIARYRKEMHGSCDDQKLRDIFDRLTYIRNLEKRKEEVTNSIEEQGKISVCAIDPNFKLVGITSTTTTDSSTYMEFSYEALNISSGAAKIVLEKGSFLKTLTIQIMSPFYDYKGEICDEAFTVGGPVVNGEVKIQYLGEDEILTSEVGNYVVYFNSLLKEELTEIIVYANPKYHGTNGYTGGHAILKIN